MCFLNLLQYKFVSHYIQPFNCEVVSFNNPCQYGKNIPTIFFVIDVPNTDTISLLYRILTS